MMREGVASVYSLTFKVGITPYATITLLMDPAGVIRLPLMEMAICA